MAISATMDTTINKITTINKMICLKFIFSDISSIIPHGFKLIFKTFQKVVCIGIVLLELVRRVFLREPFRRGGRFLNLSSFKRGDLKIIHIDLHRIRRVIYDIRIYTVNSRYPFDRISRAGHMLFTHLRIKRKSFIMIEDRF